MEAAATPCQVVAVAPIDVSHGTRHHQRGIEHALHAPELGHPFPGGLLLEQAEDGLGSGQVKGPTDSALIGDPPPVPLSVIGEPEWLASGSTMYQTDETTATTIHSMYFGLTIYPPEQSPSGQIRQHPTTIDRSCVPPTASRYASPDFNPTR